MAISRDSFSYFANAGRQIRRVLFNGADPSPGRPVLDSELNEIQSWGDRFRRLLFEFQYGSQAYSGFAVVDFGIDQDGGYFVIGTGKIVVQGFPYTFPQIRIETPDANGTDPIFIEILKYIKDRDDEPIWLAHPNTSDNRKVAEREEWVYSLLNEDTTGDGLPPGATSRSVIKIFDFIWSTGQLSPLGNWKKIFEPGDKEKFDNHIGKGGTSQHPLVTADTPGFVSNDMIAPLLSHIGEGGTSQHPLVTADLAGFQSPVDFERSKSTQNVLSLYNAWVINLPYNISTIRSESVTFSNTWNFGDGVYMGTSPSSRGVVRESQYSLWHFNMRSRAIIAFFLVRVVGGTAGETYTFRIPLLRGTDANRVFYHTAHNEKIRPSSPVNNLPRDPSDVTWTRASASISGRSYLTEDDYNSSSRSTGYFNLYLKSGDTYSIAIVAYDDGQDDDWLMMIPPWMNIPPSSGDEGARIINDPDYLIYLADGGRY